MNRTRMRLFFRLSLLMLIMSFFNLLMLLVVLFYLTFQNAFVCGEAIIRGVCVLSDQYDGWNFVMITNVSLMAVFLILASYFQQYFVDAKKPKKVKLQKVKKPSYSALLEKKSLTVYEAPSEEDAPKPIRRKQPKAQPALSLSEEGIEASDTLIEPPQDTEQVPQEVHDEPTPIVVDTTDKQQPKKQKRFKLPKKYASLPAYEAPLNQSDSETSHEITLKDPEIVATDSDDIDHPTPTKELINQDSLQEPSVKKEALHKDTVKPDRLLMKKPKKPPLEKTVNRRTLSHTKEDISVLIEAVTELDREEARHFLDTMTTVIADELNAKNKVSIHNFGTFTTSKLKARQMNVPTKDEDQTVIPEHYVIRFKASPVFNDFLNGDAELPISSPDPVTTDTENPVPKVSKKNDAITISKDQHDIIERITNETGLKEKQATTFYDTMITVLTEEISNNQKVAIHQFGTFEPSYIKPKLMKIPTSDTPVQVDGYYNINFKPSPSLIENINPVKTEKNNK